MTFIENVSSVSLDEAVDAAGGFRSVLGGYAGTDWKQWQYWGILVRDGQRIASVKLNYDRSWIVESCVPDVFWVGP
jgi:hypothetical protein